MMPRTTRIAVIVALIFITSMSTQAQTGTYTTYAGGKAIVVDQYQVNKSTDGAITIEGTLRPPGGSSGQKAVL